MPFKPHPPVPSAGGVKGAIVPSLWERGSRGEAALFRLANSTPTFVTDKTARERYTLANRHETDA
jgi:hypothetical protein